MTVLKDLTVVIACKDRDENLSLCLSSIVHCNPRPNGIYLVDFGSHTNLRVKYKAYFPYVVVIRVTSCTDTFHKARAINIGLKAVRTKYVCFTDTDQIFDPGVFGVVNHMCARYTKPFIYSSTYSIKSGIPHGVTPENVTSKYGELLELAKTESRPYGDGCLHAVKTGYAKTIHGYEEGFVGWGPEDSDFRRMAKKNKLTFIDITKNTTMIHLPHAKTGAYYSKAIYTKNLALYRHRRKIGARSSNDGNSWGLTKVGG
jgi:glycosyltransferase involved in cell wall biosynthesis